MRFREIILIEGLVFLDDRCAIVWAGLTSITLVCQGYLLIR